MFYGKIPTFFSYSETVFQRLWNDSLSLLLYLIRKIFVFDCFLPPPINSRLQVSLLLLGFASACAPLFRHDLALQGNSSVNLFFLPSCRGFVCLSNFATVFYYFCLLLLSKQPQNTLHTLCFTWLALHGIPSS